MKTIYKYNIEISPKFELDMPENFKILSVQTQNNQPVFWAEIDKNNEVKRYEFSVMGTGQTTEENGRPMLYLGTFQVNDGTFVGHFYQLLY